MKTPTMTLETAAALVRRTEDEAATAKENAIVDLRWFLSPDCDSENRIYGCARWWRIRRDAARDFESFTAADGGWAFDAGDLKERQEKALSAKVASAERVFEVASWLLTDEDFESDLFKKVMAEVEAEDAAEDAKSEWRSWGRDALGFAAIAATLAIFIWLVMELDFFLS